MLEGADAPRVAEQRLRVSAARQHASPLGRLVNTSLAVARAQEKIERVGEERQRTRVRGSWRAKESVSGSDEPPRLTVVASDDAQVSDVSVPEESGQVGDLQPFKGGTIGDPAWRDPGGYRPLWRADPPYAKLLRLWTEVSERAFVLPELRNNEGGPREKVAFQATPVRAPFDDVATSAAEPRALPVLLTGGDRVVQFSEPGPVSAIEDGTDPNTSQAAAHYPLPVPFSGDQSPEPAASPRHPATDRLVCERGTGRPRRRTRKQIGQKRGTSAMPIAARVLVIMIVVALWASLDSTDWAEPRSDAGTDVSGGKVPWAPVLPTYDSAGPVEIIAEATPYSNKAASGLTATSDDRLREVEAAPERVPTPSKGLSPARDEQSWAKLYQEGVALRAAGDLDGAIRALRAANRVNEDHAQLAYELGYALQKSGDDAGAIVEYRRTVTLKPEHGFANYNLGYLLTRSSDPFFATKYLQRAAKLLPKNVYVQFAVAQAFEREGDLPAASRAYQRVLELDAGPTLRADARVRLQRLHDGAPD